MGLFDKVTSMLNNAAGIGTEKTENMKKQIAEIFAGHVENGESYKTFGAYYLLTTKKLLKEIRTHYNYIIGYKDGDDPEIVVIPVSEDLSSVSGPVRCKKSECQKASVDDVGLIEVKHPGLEEGGVLFTVIVTRAIGGHMIDVSYMDVYQEILDFFKKRFSK